MPSSAEPETSPKPTPAALLEGVAEAVVVTDPAGTVHSVHGAAHRLLPGLAPGSQIAAFLRSARDGEAPRFGGKRALNSRRRALASGRIAWYISEPAVSGGTEGAAEAHAGFLNDATRQLGSMLHLERAVHLSVRLPVPYLAGACCYFALRPNGVAWTCTRAAPEPGPHGARVDSGEWSAATLQRTGWLVRLLEGDEPSTEPWPDGAGSDLAAVLPASLGRPGAMFAVQVRGVSGVIGALLFARGFGEPGFSEVDTAVLAEYAERVGTAVSAAALYQEQARTADTLKARLVPAPLPEIKGLGTGAAYRSAQESDQIGGDYYEVGSTSDGQVEFLFGDVCGKGSDAAVLTGLVRQSVRALRLLERRPLRLVELLNEVLLETEPEKFSTMVVGRAQPLEDGGLDVEVAAGGHPPPLLLRRDGAVEEVPLGGLFVGAVEEAVFDTARFTLHPGEVLLLYSDGVTEARNGRLGGEMLGEPRLRRLLESCRNMPAAAVAARVEQVVGDWLGGGRHDDIAVLALRPEPGRSGGPGGAEG